MATGGNWWQLVPTGANFRMGWDRLAGTDVAAALKIVFWPTHFLTDKIRKVVYEGPPYVVEAIRIL